MNGLLINQANQKAAIGVEEFREILDDVTDHFCLFKANDLESCAYYLFDSLKKAELLNGTDATSTSARFAIISTSTFLDITACCCLTTLPLDS